jgi:hypothetical protein
VPDPQCFNALKHWGSGTIFLDVINIAALFNPKLLYLTQGLWELTGTAFWIAFLFETPFVLLRVATWLLIPASMIFYLYFAYKAQKLYEKNKN